MTIQDHVAREIIDVGAWVAARGWVPATSGNFSRRIDAKTFAITASGVDKGTLSTADIRAVTLWSPVPSGVSAETPIHMALYEDDPNVGAVLHTHSLAATVVSLAHAQDTKIALSDYEIVKGIRGYRSHAETFELPLFSNSQDMDQLAKEIRIQVKAQPRMFGFVLCGHGLYAWGSDMREARRHTEAIEFLLACELDKGRYRRSRTDRGS